MSNELNRFKVIVEFDIVSFMEPNLGDICDTMRKELSSYVNTKNGWNSETLASEPSVKMVRSASAR